ncbi:hypothetical protein BpJC7_17040 [Weizmannia acidilactici]|uniref:N-acetyltransferase domain-containing protein n=1 Tax=Weizmannia acidilactici TaxID=2607726 RepID=A0A5J4JFI6_9BACI|nr:GNAT family N-acetyltransferase [Weizmannia acidilactici]GER67977.1 hypothetical protein BpJC4_24480 [Weizmannia acidilactici]GER70401.1 hypothetical protein BpJC7_17040 [Weizmannia acidilactici]GER74435.1 hypothetical protein BpPP18_25020 [Weizmannia acidilactici]
MIRQLEMKNSAAASAVWALQIPAYKKEAGLIGFDGIPPLNERVEDLMASTEKFYGYFVGEKLAGVVSVERTGDCVMICRLFVGEHFTRRGIARKLLEFVLSLPGAGRFEVSTGEKNIPAVSLYLSMGFTETGRTEVADGVWLVRFRL